MQDLLLEMYLMIPEECKDEFFEKAGLSDEDRKKLEEAASWYKLMHDKEFYNAAQEVCAEQIWAANR